MDEQYTFITAVYLSNTLNKQKNGKK